MIWGMCFSALFGFYFHLVTRGCFLSPVQGSFSTLCRIPFPPCAGFLFHTVQAPCAGFSLCRVLFVPCAGSFSLCRVPFPPCAGLYFCPACTGSFSLSRSPFPPCAGFPVQGSVSTLCRVPFPPCTGFISTLGARDGTPLGQKPSRTVLVPHCAGLKGTTAQLAEDTCRVDKKPPQGEIETPTR